jgi:hypothetical protein
MADAGGVLLSMWVVCVVTLGYYTATGQKVRVNVYCDLLTFVTNMPSYVTIINGQRSFFNQIRM